MKKRKYHYSLCGSQIQLISLNKDARYNKLRNLAGTSMTAQKTKANNNNNHTWALASLKTRLWLNKPGNQFQQSLHSRCWCVSLVLTPSVSTTSTLPFASSSICLWILRIASKLRRAFSSLQSGLSIRQKSGEESSEWVMQRGN